MYSDSFPTNDEYDFNILDAHHVHGSPYGGFGRATRSRLAALPLHLPGTVGSYTGNEDEAYLEMRDGDGRLFACKVYHEDELTPDSLAESMFTTVKLNAFSDNEEQDTAENVEEVEPVVEEETKETMSAGSDAIGANLDKELSPELQVNKALAKLDGVCTQIHKGWWSYEWCHGTKVTQFHVHVESGRAQQIQLESVTNLGDYSTSAIYTDGDPDEPDKKQVKSVDKNKEGEESEDEPPKELAVVVHEFVDGDMCEETEQPRRTTVKLKCCPLKRMNRLKRAVLFHGEPVASNIAAITKMQETSVCNYYVEVCTPLLCEGLAEAFEDGLVAKEVSKGKDPKLVPIPLTSHDKKPKDSIREILDGTLKNTCLRFFNGGWYALGRRTVVCNTTLFLCTHSVHYF